MYLCSSTNRPRRLGGIVIIAAFAAAGSLLTGAGSAWAGGAATMIERAVADEGPIVAPEEQALIDRKCGRRPAGSDGSSIRVDEGVLICGNGRRVDDPEVRAAMRRIGERAEARVEAVMSRPDVRAALSGEVSARVAAELRHDLPRIRHAVGQARIQARAAAAAAASAGAALGAVDMEEMRAEIARAELDIDRVDLEAVERDVEAALERDLVERNRRGGD